MTCCFYLFERLSGNTIGQHSNKLNIVLSTFDAYPIVRGSYNQAKRDRGTLYSSSKEQQDPKIKQKE